MSDELQLERRDGVAVLTLNRPVANALSPSLRDALMRAISDLSEDDGIRALVLRGAGNAFSAGIEVTEYDGPAVSPTLGALCAALESCPKPVVAALQGVATGGGFELALAAHWRLAAPGTLIALPDVKLGLVPGAGATQRLPRLIGAQASLELMLSGQRVDASDRRLEKALRVVEGDLLEAACEMALGLSEGGNWRRVRDRESGFSDPVGYQAAIAAVREQLPDTPSAEADIVSCVEAAQLLPFDRGLEFERAVFLDRVNAPDARAKRHFFAAEKRAAVMPESGAPAVPVRIVALVGGGDLMLELSLALLEPGLSVFLIAPDAAHGAAIVNRVREIYDQAVARGQLSSEQRDQRVARLVSGEASRLLPEADLVLDAGVQPLSAPPVPLKQSAVWAVISDGGRISDRGALSGAGSRVVGVKIHRPAHSGRLVELAVPNGADPGAVATLARFLSRLGRSVVRCPVLPGLASGNLEAAFLGAGLALCRAGASLAEVDDAARSAGFAAGPFRRADLSGLDAALAQYATHLEARGLLPPARDNLVVQRIAAGATGRRAGRGFYDYPAGGEPQPAADLPPVAVAMDPALAANLPAALLAALVNEAARLLSQDMVQRPSDIDLVVVRGLGYDRALGGMLLQADMSGLLNVLQTLRRFATISPVWQPHAMIEDLVKNGIGFYGRRP